MPDGWVLIVAAFGFGFALLATPLLLVSRLRKDPWAGRQVFLKRAGVPYGRRNPDGTFTPAGVFDSPLVHVAGRQGDWLCGWPPGSEAWFPLANAVPLEDAPAYFDSQIRINPGDAIAWDNRGIAWYFLGQPDKGLADYDEALRLDPENAGTHCNRGTAWLAKGDHDRAIEDYTAAFRLNPALAMAVYGRAQAWALRQEHDKAVADYTEAICLAPAWAAAYDARAVAWCALKEYDKAVADCTEAIRLAPADPAAHARRAHVGLLRMELDRALADFDEALRLGSANPDDFVGRAKIWLTRGAYDRAAADCTAALRLNPDHGEAFVVRGMARASTKNVLRTRLLAPADFEMAARRVPEGAPRCLCRALSWNEQKEHGKALAELTEALRLDPTNVLVLAYLAGLHATCPEERYRDGAKAVAYATQACEQTGWKVPHLLGVLASAHAEAGDFAQAVKLQQQMLATADLSDDRREEAHKQLALYEQGRPYRA
jgi:tetratricopeptide (TPR) repeat protein